MTPESFEIFSQDNLRKAIQDALPSDGAPGEKVVVGSVDEHGVQVVASFKLNRDTLSWDFQAAARRTWTGKTEVGARVLLRWS